MKQNKRRNRLSIVAFSTGNEDADFYVQRHE